MTSYYLDVFIAATLAMGIGIVVGWMLRVFWERDSLEDTGEIHIGPYTLKPREHGQARVRVNWEEQRK